MAASVVVRPIRHPWLRRYWVESDLPPPRTPPPGAVWLDGPDAFAVRACGVTAFSKEDVLGLIRPQVFSGGGMPPVRRVAEDVDVGALPVNHSMARPPCWRGVWYPWVDFPSL